MWECFHSCAPYQREGHGSFTIRKQFPRFPPDCPLSYALLAISCLTPNPLDRPNFWQLAGVLEDLRCYLIGQATCETSAAHAKIGTSPTSSDGSIAHQQDNASGTAPDVDGVSTSMRSMRQLLSRTDTTLSHEPGLFPAVPPQAGEVCR